jgi:DnaK suppressor protein
MATTTSPKTPAVTPPKNQATPPRRSVAAKPERGVAVDAPGQATKSPKAGGVKGKGVTTTMAQTASTARMSDTKASSGGRQTPPGRSGAAAGKPAKPPNAAPAKKAKAAAYKPVARTGEKSTKPTDEKAASSSPRRSTAKGSSSPDAPVLAAAKSAHAGAGVPAKQAPAPKKAPATKQPPAAKHPPEKTPASPGPLEAARQPRAGSGLLSSRRRDLPVKRTEGYTDERFLTHQGHALAVERQTYLEQASNLKAEAESLVEEMEPGDIQFDDESGEGGTVTVDRERDLALSAQALVAVDEIDHAVAKIATMTYGICENCGRLIPKARLEALPYARLCIDCKSGGLSRR